jgi:hypothetical protein
VKPALWAITSEVVEVDGDDAVCDLRLPVSLRVEHRACLELRAAEAEEFPPHGAGEDGVPVANDGHQDVVESHNLLKEGLGD